MEQNYNIEHYDRKRPELWLNARKKAFGGSSISALLDCNPYLSKLDIYCSAVNPSEEEVAEQKGDKSTEYGHNVEPLMAKFFKLNFPQYKLFYPKDIIMFRRKDKPYMCYTPDGTIIEKGTKRKGIWECKSHQIRNREDYEEWVNNKLPKRYYCQGLQGLAVGNDFDFVVYYAILNFLNFETGSYDHSEIRAYRFERESRKDDIVIIENVETDFYENHIVKHIPPDIDIDLN